MAIIRPALAEDCAAFPAIERDAARRFASVNLTALADGDPLPTSVALALLADVHGVVQVALIDGRPVGFALAGPVDGGLHLHELSVETAHGGRGIGAALLASVIAIGARRGMASVTLSTFADVPWNGPFYAGHGFEVLAEAAWTPGLRRLRDAEITAGLPVDRRRFMRRTLTPSSPAPPRGSG